MKYQAKTNDFHKDVYRLKLILIDGAITRNEIMHFKKTNRMVSAYLIDESERAAALSFYFEDYSSNIEELISAGVVNLCRDLEKSHYEFVRLSNAGFYMYPNKYKYCRVEIVDGEFSEIINKESVGIIACMYQYSELMREDKSGMFSAHFSLLRDFARQQDDRALIFRAITSGKIAQYLSAEQEGVNDQF